MEKETLDLLNEAVNEIKSLRQANSVMGARLDMFDKMMLLFQSTPAQPGQGWAPDIVYTIQKHIDAQFQPDNSQVQEQAKAII